MKKIRYILIASTILILILCFRYLLPLVLPFVLAYFFAKMVSPIIHFLTQRLKWKKKVSVIMVVVMVVAALSGFFIYICGILISQSILFLQRLPVFWQQISRILQELCCHCDDMLELSGGTSYEFVENQMETMQGQVGTDIIPMLSNCAVTILGKVLSIGSGLFIFFLSTLLILLDDSFPKINQKIRPFIMKLKYAGLAYIKAQLIIIFIIAAVTSVGLFIMGNEYAVLFGALIALFDAFPIVGSGIVLIPWAILKLLEGNFFHAAVLLTIFVVASLLREMLEPKLFGKEIGMKPLFVLISVYVGVKLFQIPGIILGPIALTILKSVNELIKEKAGERERKPE